MPNRWGRIDMDGIQAMSHACQHELQLTTAFGSNMFRNAGLIRPKSEPSIVEIPAATLNATLKKAQRKAEEKHDATRSMSSQKNASASRASTSKSQTFMARHRQRLDDKADAMREEMRFDIVLAGKASCSPCLVPGGVVGPISGISWATWEGKMLRSKDSRPAPKPKEPPKIQEGNFIEAAARAAVAPSVMALPREGIGPWAKASAFSRGRLEELSGWNDDKVDQRPSSAPDGKTKCLHPGSRPLSRTGSKGAQLRPDSAADMQRAMSKSSKDDRDVYAWMDGLEDLHHKRVLFGCEIAEPYQPGAGAWRHSERPNIRPITVPSFW